MKKILLYISDGVGCRNFVYSSFIDNAINDGFEVVILKNVPFDFDTKGCKVVAYPSIPLPPMVDIYKSIKIVAELTRFAKKFNNDVYLKYIFKWPSKRLIDKLKNIYKYYCLSKANTEEKILDVEKKMYKAALGSDIYYAICNILDAEKPDVVMFTNQRSLTNIPVVLACEKFKIPSLTNIFSWDNLPKATKIHKSDYYFVWSSYMKNELIMYYPYIDSDRIKITGTPQFSSYHDSSDILPRNLFLERYSLDPTKRYICFSGDDVVTSPHDDIFLRDLCNEVRKYNSDNNDILRVLFRRCPTDRSSRYDEVLNAQSDILTPIEPLWKSVSEDNWQSSYPLKEDISLLKNILYHSDLVINFGSTVAIDASFFDTPACYLKYQPVDSTWNAALAYSFIHFDTAKGLNPVFWINDLSDYKQVFTKVLNGNYKEILNDAKRWSEVVILHPVDKVMYRMIEEIKKFI